MAGTFTFDEAFTPETPAPRAKQPATFSFDEAIADPARQELPAGVKSSTAGGGRGNAYPGMTLADAKPSRAQRIAEMDSATEAINPAAMPSLSGASVVRAGRREPIDERRTPSEGRVRDANIPSASPLSLARDGLSGALQIVPVVVKGAGDITRLATGDRFGRDVSGFAERTIKNIKENVGSERARQQETQFQQDMLDPALDAQDVVAGNPGAMADMILPAVGSMALPIGAAGVASKLATTGNAARLAAAIDPATVAARAATAGGAASTATVIAQNAASGFADSRDTGFPLDQSYLRAAITAPFTYVASRVTGGGAEGQVARAMFGKQTAAAGAKAAAGAALKEGGQEGGEAIGDYVGETVGKGEEFDLNKASKQVAVGTVLGTVMGGSTHVLTNRIQRLKANGETEAASHLERIVATDNAKTELTNMGEAAQHPKFQEAYRAQREQGMKPAEAAARSAMATGFDELATTAGISQKAMAAAREAAAKLPIDKAPTWLDKFVASMTSQGQGQAMEPGSIADMLSQARDNAVNSVVDSLYSDSRKTMDDIMTMEQNQSPTTESTANEEARFSFEAATADAVPKAVAEGNARLPGSTGPILEAGATQPDPVALNGVRDDANTPPRAPAEAQAQTSQAPEAGAVDPARFTPTRDAAGAGPVQANGLKPVKDNAYKVASSIFGKDIYSKSIQNDWQNLLDAMDQADPAALNALAKKYQRDERLDGMGSGTSGAGPGKVSQARHGGAQLARFARQAADSLQTETNQPVTAASKSTFETRGADIFRQLSGLIEQLPAESRAKVYQAEAARVQQSADNMADNPEIAAAYRYAAEVLTQRATSNPAPATQTSAPVLVQNQVAGQSIQAQPAIQNVAAPSTESAQIAQQSAASEQAGRNEQLIDLRKRKSVLNSLFKCMNAG